MENLPDDCLIIILMYLDLKSQFALSNLHTRFRNILPIVWRSQYKTIDISLDIMGLPENDWQYFFQNICKTIKKIRIKFVEREHIKILTSFKFPQVDDLRFHLFNRSCVKDCDIAELQNSFPNLKTLSPMGNYTGDQFVNYKSLESLTLLYCGVKFKPENLKKIIVGNRLKVIKLCLFDVDQVDSISLPKESLMQLEIIEIDADELQWFIKYFHEMKHLKQLQITGSNIKIRGQELINKFRARYFHVLETSNLSVLKSVFDFNLHVDQFKIVSCPFHSQRLTVSSFENISRIYFVSCGIYLEDLTDLMLKSRHLDVISFDYCIFQFNDYVFDGQEIARRRNKELTLYLLRLSGFSWRIQNKSNLFNVYTDKTVSYSYYPVFMQIKTE